MSTANTTAWQRKRALMLDAQFRLLQPRIEAGCKLTPQLESLVYALDGATCDGKPLRLSVPTLRRAWQRWTAGGRTPESLLLEYKSGALQTPRELIAEYQRRATQPGCKENSVAINSLRNDWLSGKPLPGVGTWKDWWRKSPKTKHLPMPDAPPEFFDVVASQSTFYRHAPGIAIKAAGTMGRGEARKHLPYVKLNYTQLRRGELYTLDDVRLDVVCIDDATGRVTTVICYIMMEVGSRYIPAYLVKPAESIKAEDVDELVAYTLQTCGVGDGYTTHILFERGTVACSENAQLVLEGASEGELKIHRTGMVGGVQWIGAPAEKKRGNSSAKGCIEAFNRQLHLLLKDLPGQRGNHYDTQPSVLGYTGQRNKDGSHATHKGGLVHEAERLAQFDISTGRRLRLQLPFLYFSEIERAMRAAIKRHNAEPGHNYSGHAKRRHVETAPGVWEPLS